MTVVDDSIVSGASKSARISRTGIRLKLGSAERTAVHIYEVQRAKGTEAERGSLIRGGEQRCTDWRIARRFAGRLQVKPMQPAERRRSRADRRRGRAGILNKDSNVTSGSDPGKLL